MPRSGLKWRCLSRRVFLHVAELICTAGLLERKNVGIASTTQKDHGVFKLMNYEEQILVAIMVDIKSCHPHSLAFTIRGTIIQRCWLFVDLFLYIRWQRHIFSSKPDGAWLNYGLGVPYVVPRQMQAAKR